MKSVFLILVVLIMLLVNAGMGLETKTIVVGQMYPEAEKWQVELDLSGNNSALLGHVPPGEFFAVG